MTKSKQKPVLCFNPASNMLYEKFKPQTKTKTPKSEEVVSMSKDQARYQTDVEYRERRKEIRRKSYTKKQEVAVPDFLIKKEARAEVSRQLKLAARRKAYVKRKKTS